MRKRVDALDRKSSLSSLVLVIQDKIFFLEKLDYEVLRNGISGTSSDNSSEVMAE